MPLTDDDIRRKAAEFRQQPSTGWLEDALGELQNRPLWKILRDSARGAGRGAVQMLDQFAAANPVGQAAHAVGLPEGPTLESLYDQAFGGGEGKIEKVAEMAGPPLKAGAKALGMAPALVGALRRGGDPSLIASHTVTEDRALRARHWGDVSDPQGLKLKSVEGHPELYSPSFAVTKGYINPHFVSADDVNLHYIPKVGFGDPAVNPSNLYNRDAYTSRFQDYEGQRFDREMGRAGQEFNAKGRIQDRFRSDSEKFKEGVSPSISQVAAISSSPSFNSFKQYEQSPRGANLLTTSPESPKIDQYDQIFGALLTGDKAHESGYPGLSNLIMSLPSAQRMTMLKALADQGNPVARSLLALSRNAPSHYGELKVQGPVQVSRNNFAGVLVEPGRDWERWNPKAQNEQYLDTLIQSLEQSYGVPVRRAQGLPWKDFDLATQLQEAAGPYGKQPL